MGKLYDETFENFRASERFLELPHWSSELIFQFIHVSTEFIKYILCAVPYFRWKKYNSDGK